MMNDSPEQLKSDQVERSRDLKAKVRAVQSLDPEFPYRVRTVDRAFFGELGAG